MKNFLLLFYAGMASLYAHAETGTVPTFPQGYATDAKGSHLRAQANELVALVKDKQYATASHKAVELRKIYEASFDPKLKQYTFQSQAEFNEFRNSSNAKFEWIDWGYKDCLQVQAFMAGERKNFAAALDNLKTLESIAPMSAEVPAEAGYVLNQLGQYEEGLAAYRRAHALSAQYASQSVYRAPALRGIGFALIELKQLDQAERTFLESLEIEPENKIALSELAYLRQLRGAK